MISGRYRTQHLCRHWSGDKTGGCLICQSSSTSPPSSISEDLPHILQYCEALTSTREKLILFTDDYCNKQDVKINNLIRYLCDPSSPTFCQFLLDCSCLPTVINATQENGPDVLHHLFHVTRTWVYTIHKERLKLLGRWNIY